MLSLHGSQSPSYLYHDVHNVMVTDAPGQSLSRRKRKAETQDNERLSKRLSLLNLERNGQKLYVPVESKATPVANNHSRASAASQDNLMQVDDSKHKVYIYNLDDELSSSESEAEDGRLVFIPDIERHLFANRIPPVVKANSAGEYAGMNLGDMQLVLYNVPTSLTVEPEKDSVRKAIIEARHRMREKQKEGSGQTGRSDQIYGNKVDTTPFGRQGQESMSFGGAQLPEDPDAMDLDLS